jgi:hypothetical protein
MNQQSSGVASLDMFKKTDGMLGKSPEGFPLYIMQFEADVSFSAECRWTIMPSVDPTLTFSIVRPQLGAQTDQWGKLLYQSTNPGQDVHSGSRFHIVGSVRLLMSENGWQLQQMTATSINPLEPLPRTSNDAQWASRKILAQYLQGHQRSDGEKALALTNLAIKLAKTPKDVEWSYLTRESVEARLHQFENAYNDATFVINKHGVAEADAYSNRAFVEGLWGHDADAIRDYGFAIDRSHGLPGYLHYSNYQSRAALLRKQGNEAAAVADDKMVAEKLGVKYSPAH